MNLGAHSSVRYSPLAAPEFDANGSALVRFVVTAVVTLASAIVVVIVVVVALL